MNGTSSRNDLEMNCYNKELFSYNKNSDNDTINIVRYSIRNNSNHTYFINNIVDLNEL